jgi:formimidoylglutamate deiminase
VPGRARLRPIELLDRERLPDAPHDDRPRDARRRSTSSTCWPPPDRAICACPTTEANLGDGFLPVARVEHRGIPLCIGSDSNVRIDPLEELRELEGIGRRQTGKRGVFPTDALYEIGSAAGARALGIDAWPSIEIDLDHPSLAGVAPEHASAALIAGCGADVVLSAT